LDQSLSSSAKAKNIANKLLNHYGNCSNFKLCNENDVFVNQMLDNNVDKDFSMLLSTPPSNSHKPTKYVIANSTNNKGAIFSCTPRDDNQKNQVKEEYKPTTMFSQTSHAIPQRAHSPSHTQGFL
jgi:hypothetical protein